MSDADKPELRQANDNPWYCLATLHGEQRAEGHLNEELEAANRNAWNRWVAPALSDQQRTELAKDGFETELEPLTAEERNVFFRAFDVRTGRDEMPPEPTDDVDLSYAF